MLIQSIHHMTWKCRDIEETRDFYDEILGLPMVHLETHDMSPDGESYLQYKKIYFELGFCDLGDNLGAKTDTEEWVVDIALAVDSEQELLYGKTRLEACGVGVIGPIEHELFKSIYFFDPNGLKVELVYKK